MLEKATFFVLKTSHINGIRVTITACNSYPYYQDLGFFDTTKKGNHGEPLLVYKPKNLETNKKEKPIKSLFKKVFNIN
ncbi:TPA: hypothetical protein SLA86_002588 [Staphylococcus aureus]|nr:hypothetical protein [Staphylococcus aureus]